MGWHNFSAAVPEFQVWLEKWLERCEQPSAARVDIKKWNDYSNYEQDTNLVASAEQDTVERSKRRDSHDRNHQ